MDTRTQLAIVSSLLSFTVLGALYASMKHHMGYADALLGFFILLIIYSVYLFFKEILSILSYEYDWTDKEIAKMNEGTEITNERK
ncbi:hypothetical protein [uncultured Methanolobus sp.]|uniref:hypothetical protein n=1 Tax=uncultured Methanolobus sp. TaxID=218300 RepID=UPI002AABC8A7|nr:hypothetical protein [uncultured Methanolobus sp.]